MWTSSKATSALALALLLAGPAAAETVASLRAYSLFLGDVPTVGECLSNSIDYLSCTDLGDFDPSEAVAAVAVQGTVRVRSLSCWVVGFSGIQFLQPEDSVTHCVAWMSDADQTPECITGASVALTGDTDSFFSPSGSISEPSSFVSLTSGGALVIMVSAATDGGSADDSNTSTHCLAAIETIP